jgi:hypothetical protein
MGTTRKGLVLFALLFLVGVALIGFGPLIRCIYNHHRFERSVKVDIETTSCRDEISGIVSSPCRCIFAFEGEGDSRAIQFSGDGLHYVYDPRRRAFNVTGTGLITYKNDLIRVDGTRIFFNNQVTRLGGPAPVLSLAGKNGSLANGYCELRW